MAEQMTDEAKAQLLERVAKLIENDLGYKVERIGGGGHDYINQLYLEGLSRGFRAYIVLGDIEEGGLMYRTVYTGKVKVIATNGEYGRDYKFKKWSIASTLNFDKGIADKKTAAFLAKVKDLVETVKAKEDFHNAKTAKRKSDNETITEWFKRPEMPKGYRLLNQGTFVLLIDGESDYSNDFRVTIGVVSNSNQLERLGNQCPVYCRIQGTIVYGDRVDDALRLYKQFYNYLKA